MEGEDDAHGGEFAEWDTVRNDLNDPAPSDPIDQSIQGGRQAETGISPADFWRKGRAIRVEVLAIVPGKKDREYEQ